MKKTIMIIGIAMYVIIFALLMFLSGCKAEEDKMKITDFSEIPLEDLYPGPKAYFSNEDIKHAYKRPTHYMYSIEGKVDSEELYNYISALQTSGFTKIDSYYEEDDYVIYNATTPDNVYKVRLAYYEDQENLTIIFDDVEALFGTSGDSQ